jgi:segregation and condensation protein A
MAEESLRHPRAVGLEERYAGLLPEVLLGLGPDELSRLASRALAPKPVPEVSLAHVHAPRVSVREQAAWLVRRLRQVKTSTFRALVADCPDTLHVVGRFLALLELYRESAVAFEQVSALGELHVRWTGSDDGELEVEDEFEDQAAVEEDGETPAAPPTAVSAQEGTPEWTT